MCRRGWRRASTWRFARRISTGRAHNSNLAWAVGSSGNRRPRENTPNASSRPRSCAPGRILLLNCWRTLLYEDGAYFLLENHLERLSQSAAYWGFCYADDRVRAQLQDAAKAMEGRCRVRLLLARNGQVRLQHQALTSARRLRVALAAEPVDSTDPLLYHKTTHRVMYDRQLAVRPDCDDVVLYNERDELTECCIGNLVLERDGVRYTASG